MKYDCRPLRDADICFWNSLTCCPRIYTEIRQPQFSTHTRETGCTPGTRVDLSLAGAQTKWFKSAIKTICAHSHRWVDTVPTDGPNESQRENLDRKRKCNRYFQRVAVMIWAISLWSEKPIESREPWPAPAPSYAVLSVVYVPPGGSRGHFSPDQGRSQDFILKWAQRSGIEAF